MRRLLVAAALSLCALPPPPARAQAAAAPARGAVVTLPRKEGSVKFAVIGDTGRGDREQFEVGKQMAAFHVEFPFDFVIMVGDNIYGADTPADMRLKFEDPYKALLDAKVQFRAVLGNHDNPNQRFYKPFNMEGERYYTFRASKGGIAKLTEGGVRFFALDSNYLSQEQLDWLNKEMAASGSDWKIPFFHHPLYSSGKTHGSALESRATLEPLFVKYGVSVVFTGHDHFYERSKPQKGGIVHFVVGAGGSLRKGDIRPTDLTAKGFDRDYSFMLVEIAGEDLYFQTVSRTGETIDSGTLRRPGASADTPPSPTPPPAPVAAPAVAPTGRSTPEGEKSPSPPASPSPSPSPSASPSPRPKPR